MAFEYELKTNSVVDVLNEVYQYLLNDMVSNQVSTEGIDTTNADSIIEALNKINSIFIDGYEPKIYVPDALRELFVSVGFLPQPEETIVDDGDN